MRKKIIAGMLTFALWVSGAGVGTFAEITRSDMNFMLERIATTQDADKKALGVELLKMYLDNTNPDVSGLQRAIRIATPMAERERLEQQYGYSFDEVVASLNALAAKNRSEIQQLIQAVEASDLQLMKNIMSQTTTAPGSGGGGGGAGGIIAPPIQPSVPKIPLIPKVFDDASQQLLEVTLTDIEDHWARDTIYFLAQRNIIKGSDNKFNPNANITRAEFTALVVKVLGLESTADYKIEFQDVIQNDWFYEVVKTAKQYNLIHGIGEGRFGPNNSITREQMVTIIMNALVQMNISMPSDSSLSIDKFDDKQDISDWAVESIQNATALGIINGITPSQLLPRRLATKAEAAVMIKKVFDLINQK